MRNTEQMTNEINNIVTEAIDAAKMEAAYNGKQATFEGFSMELDVMLMGLSFENETAERIFKGLCLSALSKVDKDFKDMVQPPMFMDANGNYTTDKKLWA